MIEIAESELTYHNIVRVADTTTSDAEPAKADSYMGLFIMKASPGNVAKKEVLKKNVII
jgi:hypothetical protein